MKVRCGYGTVAPGIHATALHGADLWPGRHNNLLYGDVMAERILLRL